ncbi:MAG: hypothetical protein CL607_28030 [Anaerolineaceae bacterium]|nr:hypothetical protein [Anaerolineaceae bacterium]
MSDEKQTPPEPRPEEKMLNDLKEKGDELKGTLKDWGIDLDQFLNRANQAGEEAKSQFMKAVNDLQAAVDEQTQDKPPSTSTAAPTEPTKDAADEFFKEMEAAVKDIQAGFKAAGERLHKQLDTAIEQSKETAEERGERLGDEADDLMDRINNMADDMTDEDE